MDSRVVLDALSPPPVLFASHLRQPDHAASAQTLRHSIRRNFPPPLAPPTLTDDMRARVVNVSSLPELQRVILCARAQKKRVRAGVCAADTAHHVAFLEQGGVFVDTSDLRKAVLHRSRGVVVAQAGVLLSDLETQVEALGAFSQCVNLAGGSGVRSVGGGVVSGVLGGGGVMEGLLADVICEVSFVDAFGRLRVVSDGQGSGVFRALKLSLGLFGVVYDVSIRVNSFRRVAKVSSLFLPMRALVGGGVSRAVRSVVERKGGVEITWVPFNSWMKCGSGWTPEEDVVWVRTLERVVEGAGRPPADLDEEHDVVFRFLTPPQWLSLNATRLERLGYRAFQPEHVKTILGLGFEDTAWKLETTPYVQSYAHAVQYQDNADAFPSVEVAVAFPLRPSKEEDWDVLQDAWKLVMRKVAECDMKREYPLNIAMKTTFVRASDALFAPNFAHSGQGRRNSCSAVVKVMSAKNTMGWRQFAGDVVAAWMQLRGSRCHLSREVAAICSPDTIAKSLGESLRMFKSVRKNAAVDDYGMFSVGPFADLLGIQAQADEFKGSPISSAASCERDPSRRRNMDGLFDAEINAESCCTRKLGRTAGCKENIDHEGRKLNDVPLAIVNLSSPWTPVPTLPHPNLSPVHSKTSLTDDSSEHCDDGGGYEGDNDESSAEEADDTSVANEVSRLILSVPMEPRKGTRRRKAKMANHASLSTSEHSLLIMYIVLYVVLWLSLFGGSALRGLGWIS